MMTKNSFFFLFLQRKVIGIRPQDTVRDLIKKCIDTSYLRVGDINLSFNLKWRRCSSLNHQDPVVDNYVLYVINDLHSSSNTHSPMNSSSSQLNSSSLIPLIGKFTWSIEFLLRRRHLFVRYHALWYAQKRRRRTRKNEEKKRESEISFDERPGIYTYIRAYV